MQNTAIFGAKIHIHEVRANGATVPGKIKAVVPDIVGRVEKLFELFLADICTNILWKRNYSISRFILAEFSILVDSFI